jgi:hypothetical protein
MSPRVFYFHYNKPASLSAGRPQLSVHFAGTCYIVDGVDCRVPTWSRNRRTQPRCVIAGRALSVTLEGGRAVIRR